MAEIFAIRTGQTIWELESRLDSATGAPLTDEGARSVQDCARQLARESVAVVYAGSGEAERQSAELLAGPLQSRVRTVSDLRELDYGLWQGLTVSEIKRRQPKLFRQWLEAPASVRPPGGETLEEGLARLRKALKEILKRPKTPPVVLVLRPVMLGLLRCVVRNQTTDDVWQNVSTEFTWDRYDVSGDQI